MQLKQFYYIATKVSSRKSATTFGDLPDCWYSALQAPRHLLITTSSVTHSLFIFISPDINICHWFWHVANANFVVTGDFVGFVTSNLVPPVTTKPGNMTVVDFRWLPNAWPQFRSKTSVTIVLINLKWSNIRSTPSGMSSIAADTFQLSNPVPFFRFHCLHRDGLLVTISPRHELRTRKAAVIFSRMARQFPTLLTHFCGVLLHQDRWFG